RRSAASSSAPPAPRPVAANLLASRLGPVGPSKPRRAGTRLVPRAVREEQMLGVAGDVFAERGFHAASMDEIADRADISKPMLYAYFGSKEGLYSAYVERAGADLLARMDAAVDPSLQPDEQVRASMM